MIRHTLNLPGLFAAILAIAVQIGFAASVPAEAADAAVLRELGALSVICHTDNDTADGQRSPAHHHAPDCAFCLFCQAMVHPAPLLGDAPAIALPLVRLVLLAFPPVPPARAPPTRPFATAFPRGPPALH